MTVNLLLRTIITVSDEQDLFPAAYIVCWYSEPTIQIETSDYGEEYVKITNQGPIYTCIVLTSHLAT